MLHCTPFLLFDGNCAEAMTFYQKCLGGDLTLTKLGDTPMKATCPDFVSSIRWTEWVRRLSDHISLFSSD